MGRCLFRAGGALTPARQLVIGSLSAGREWVRARLHSSAVCAAAAAGDADRQVRVRHILLRPDQQSLADELKQTISTIDDLSEYAAQHSACPSKRQGGDLGWISRGRTVPEFEAAAFAAAPGELVACQTQFGAHLLMVTDEREVAAVQQMTVEELAELLEAVAAGGAEDIQLVDVREEREEELASLPGFQLLPLSRFEQWGPHITKLLDPSRKTICLCHHGVRSMQMANFLVDTAGFTSVTNVVGGIDAYSRTVDPSVPMY